MTRVLRVLGGAVATSRRWVVSGCLPPWRATESGADAAATNVQDKACSNSKSKSNNSDKSHRPASTSSHPPFLVSQHHRSFSTRNASDVQRWIPPGRWSGPPRSRARDNDDDEEIVDQYQKIDYELREWPLRPMPVKLETALKAKLASPSFALDNELLYRLANRMFSMPKPRVGSDQHTGKRAAVMLPLCVVDGEPSVLLTLRSQNVGTHKGQVSFPGGHLDLEDECMEGCANRECLEELGVRVEAPLERALWEAEWKHRPYFPQSNILGRLPNCVAITGTLVTPVVGFLGDVDLSEVTATMSKQEIDEVFCLPLRDILNPRSVIHENINMGNRMPAFTCGRHKVWGLTAYILHHFLMECFVPALLVNRPAQRLF